MHRNLLYHGWFGHEHPITSSLTSFYSSSFFFFTRLKWHVERWLCPRCLRSLLHLHCWSGQAQSGASAFNICAMFKSWIIINVIIYTYMLYRYIHMVHHGDVYTHCKDVPMMSYCVLTMAHMIFRSLASKALIPTWHLVPLVHRRGNRQVHRFVANVNWYPPGCMSYILYSSIFIYIHLYSISSIHLHRFAKTCIDLHPFIWYLTASDRLDGKF